MPDARPHRQPLKFETRKMKLEPLRVGGRRADRKCAQARRAIRRLQAGRTETAWRRRRLLRWRRVLARWDRQWSVEIGDPSRHLILENF